MNIKVNSERSAAVNQTTFWVPIAESKPPVGVKLLLINERNGVAVLGTYSEKHQWTHWQGLPKFAESGMRPAGEQDQAIYQAIANNYHQQPTMSGALRDLIEGMSVSVDVSTGDHDAGHRYFGTVTEVMDGPDDKHGVTILVQDAKPNFYRPQGEQKPVAVVDFSTEGWRKIVDALRALPDGAQLYTHPQNLNCKSTQARLATLWGYVKEQPPREPLTNEAKAVIDAAREAMDESTESYNGRGGISIASELAAALSLRLDEYDRAHGIGHPAAVPQQFEQEPVATLHCTDECYVYVRVTDAGKRMRFEQPIDLYTHPQREPLTTGQILSMDIRGSEDEALRFARAIEWKHGIGGAT